MGSAVCSNYGKKYGDAYMKFAVGADKSKIYLPAHGTRISPACEHYLQEDIFGGARHQTPGVDVSSNAECTDHEKNLVLRDVMNMEDFLKT